MLRLEFGRREEAEADGLWRAWRAGALGRRSAWRAWACGSRGPLWLPLVDSGFLFSCLGQIKGVYSLGFYAHLYVFLLDLYDVSWVLYAWFVDSGFLGVSGIVWLGLLV